MRAIGRNEACPCGSTNKLKRCCGQPLYGGHPASSAEALMRSRYTAYVLGEVDYLFQTTHPTNPAVAGISLEQLRLELLDYCRRVTFHQLTVHQTWSPDARGIARVSFTAAFESDGEASSLSEISDFVMEQGRWQYLRGRPPLAHSFQEVPQSLDNTPLGVLEAQEAVMYRAATG